MWFSTEREKSGRYWNPWKIYVKESFFIPSYFNFCWNYTILRTFKSFFKDFSETFKVTIRYCKKTTTFKWRLFCRYSLNLYKIKLHLLVCISLLHKCKIIIFTANKTTFQIMNLSLSNCFDLMEKISSTDNLEPTKHNN